MKIVSIFDENLYAFQFGNENELKKILGLWSNTAHLYQFIQDNIKDAPKGVTTIKLVNKIIDDANEIDDTLDELSENGGNFDYFFKALDNSAYRFQVLSKSKGRNNYLRLYALKIDKDCYVITGGAIKFHHLMEDREHTKIELGKLEKCKQYLQEKGVIDNESFYEFLNEEL